MAGSHSKLSHGPRRRGGLKSAAAAGGAAAAAAEMAGALEGEGRAPRVPRAAAGGWIGLLGGGLLTRSAPTRFRANWLKKSPDTGVTGSVSSAVAGLPYQSSASFW